MKKKIVVWATDENEKKLLVGLELKAKENKIAIHTFPEEIATEALYNDMMDKWRADKEVQFPEGHTSVEKELNITETLLPDNIKVTRGDLINRASTEWHFIVLSTKLYELYKSELEEKKEKVMNMTSYDGSIWNEMKEFWNKVQQQVFDNNLLRNHAGQLKEGTNKVFDKLKELRTVLDKEFDELSKKNKGIFSTKLAEVEAKIEKGLGLKPIFDELKNIQNEYKNTKFNKKDRTEIWNRLDGAFKSVKDKKFGKSGGPQGNNAVGRVERRYQGLMSAIGKMEHSINRDRKDIEYENRKINTTSGQLEQQIRQAKLKMIEERISSKDIKLKEMLATKKELEAKLEKEKKRAEVVKAKEAAKSKIANQIQLKSADVSAEEKSKIEKAAQNLKKKEVTAEPRDKTTAKEKIAAVAPIAAVAAGVKSTEAKAPEVKAPEVKAPEVKAPEVKTPELKAEEVKAKEVKVEEPQDKAAPTSEESAVESNISDTVEDVKDTVEDAIHETKEAVSDAVENVMEKAAEISADIKEKGIMAGLAGAVGGMVAAASDTIKDTVESAKDLAGDAASSLSEAVGGEDKVEIVGSATETRKDAVNDLLNTKPEDVAGAVTEEKKSGVGTGLFGAAAGVVGGLIAKAADLAEDAVDKAKEIGDVVEDKVDGLVDATIGEEE